MRIIHSHRALRSQQANGADPVPPTGSLRTNQANFYSGGVRFSDEERAELIAALSRTADMVAGLLDALDLLRLALEAGRQPTEGDLQRLREHSALWRRQLEKLRSRLSGLTIDPPTRVL